MKFAFMSFSCPELSLEDMLSLAKRLGYVAVEPRAQAKHAHGIEFEASASERDAIRKTVDASGVPLCCMAVSCRYADPATCDEHLADTRKAIDLAGDLGIPRLRVFGGQLGEGVERPQAIENVSNAFKSVADQAAERGVTLCFETHDDWCDPADVAAVMKQVDHPNITVNWDIMHPVRRAGSTMDEAFNTLKPWIRHVHVHDGVTHDDGKLEMVPIGQGIIDHKRALELLHEMNYDGYISGEWINWQPYEEHLPRELSLLKEIEAAVTA